MNSVRLVRKYASFILTRNYQVFTVMEKNNENPGLLNNQVQDRIVTRSYSKQLADNVNDSKKPFSVQHNATEKEFYIKMSDEEQKGSNKAILTYEWEGPKVVDLQHTYVPDAFRGKGVAKLLAEEAFEHFTTEGATMRLSCSYLQKYATDKKSKYTNSNFLN